MHAIVKEVYAYDLIERTTRVTKRLVERSILGLYDDEFDADFDVRWHYKETDLVKYRVVEVEEEAE